MLGRGVVNFHILLVYLPVFTFKTLKHIDYVLLPEWIVLHELVRFAKYVHWLLKVLSH